MSYDSRQLAAVLTTCRQCGRAHYATHPQPLCMACRETSQPRRRRPGLKKTRTSRCRHFGLVRVLVLAKRLEGARYVPPLAILAAEYAVHVRTIRRDLEALERAGWTVPAWRYDNYQPVEAGLPRGLARRFRN